jgi:ribosomal protein S18 acetylase RimI-like enzyme
MSGAQSAYVTEPIQPSDASCGFSCGVRALDEYLARHAVRNARSGVGRAYVLRRAENDPEGSPPILGFYVLSMASAEPTPIGRVLSTRVPRYPMPVALIGRLAVDRRAQGRRVGERLLVDALRRIADAAALLGCMGVVVDAKDHGAARFYAKYGFVVLEETPWPRRMFLPMATVHEVFAE